MIWVRTSADGESELERSHLLALSGSVAGVVPRHVCFSAAVTIVTGKRALNEYTIRVYSAL